MTLPTDQLAWQSQLDTWFPGQVNVRIQSSATADAGDNEGDIDFASTGLTVIGLAGQLPVLLFWSNDGASKDFALVPESVQVKQTEPRVLVAMTDHIGRTWLFWPRPGNERAEAQKITERAMAMSSAAAYMQELEGVTK